MKTTTFLAFSLALALPARESSAQTALIRPTIVLPRADIAERLAKRYDTKREHLWCVTSWTTTATETYDRVDITGVEEQSVVAGKAEIPNGSERCRAKDGTALPMIHSHPPDPSACQASPEDLTTFVGRETPFDGILCAPTSLVWYFAPKELAAWAAQARASLVEP